MILSVLLCTSLSVPLTSTEAAVTAPSGSTTAQPSTRSAPTEDMPPDLKKVQIALSALPAVEQFYDDVAQQVRADANPESFRVVVDTFANTLNTAIAAWNLVSPQSAHTSTGEAILAQLRKERVRGQTLDEAERMFRQASQSERNANSQTCRDFIANIQQQKDSIRLLLQNDDSLTKFINTPGQVRQHVTAMKVVADTCNESVHQSVNDKTCPKFAQTMGHRIATVCALARSPGVALRSCITNFARIQATPLRRAIEKFDENEGWLPFTKPVTYKKNMFFTRDARKALKKSLVPLLKAAGLELDQQTEAEITAFQTQLRDTLRGKVDRAAPEFGLPENKLSKGATMRAIRKALKRMHPRAKITGLYWAKANEQRKGIIVFRLPKERWCQVRRFNILNAVSETAIELGEVRFQANCGSRPKRSKL